MSGEEQPLFSVTRREDGAVVLAGEIDISCEHVLSDALLDGSPDEPVVLDMSGVTFLDSSGLRVLLGVQQRRGLTVTAASPRVIRVVEATGLRGVLLKGLDDGTT